MRSVEAVRACGQAALQALPPATPSDVAIMGLLDACVRIIRAQTGKTSAEALAQLAGVVTEIAETEAEQ